MYKMSLVLCLSAVLYFLGGLVVPPLAISSTYPSASVMTYLPGYHEPATEAGYSERFPTGQSVVDWELTHSDLVIGSNYDGLALQNGLPSVGYTYFHLAQFRPNVEQPNVWLRESALQQKLDPEDDFLHFNEDTTVAVDQTSAPVDTAFYGHPFVVGSVNHPSDGGKWLYQTGSYDADAWSGHQNGGGVYVYLWEKFDAVELAFSQRGTDGKFVLEYPVEIDEFGVVSVWRTLDFDDGTQESAKDGFFRWVPPADWQYAATHDGTAEDYYHGPHFGNQYLKQSGKAWVVRIRWEPASASSPVLPRLAKLRLRRWLEPAGSQALAPLVVPGWDAQNDTNKDGYVSDEEFLNRTNITASARFRYESRACSLTSTWSSKYDYCVLNLANPNTRNRLAIWLVDKAQQNGHIGYYNDDVFRHIGRDGFDILSGGQLQELQVVAGAEPAFRAYTILYKDLQQDIKQLSGGELLLGANVSGRNLFRTPVLRDTFDAFGLHVHETYFDSHTGLTGLTGFLRAFDMFALAPAGKKAVIQGRTDYGSSHQQNTVANWEQDKLSNLARYYLLQTPGVTWYHSWGRSFTYGSHNTTAYGYHSPGIPRNVAYQPSDALLVDIGKPKNRLPKSLEPVEYITVVDGVSDYLSIGNSTDVELKNAALPVGSIEVTPSNLYYAWRGEPHPQLENIPLDAVVARRYTKGLVMLRLPMSKNQAGYSDLEPIELNLGGVYQVVNADGSLAEPSNRIFIAPYEGVILKKVLSHLRVKHH